MQLARLTVIIQAIAAVFFAADVFADASPASAAKPRVDTGVHRTLKRQGTVNIMVTMRAGTDLVIKSMAQEASFPTRGAKIQALVEKLEAHANSTQSEITQLLAHESSTTLASEVKSFWITNQVFFRDATFELVEKLSSVASVAAIEEETMSPLPTIMETSTNATKANVAASDGLWGISKIRAPQVWADGTTGQGIVIGSLDTGVRATHEVLRNNFRKEFGWYHATTQAEEPFDETGHGTYTMGTFVGANGVGVAPGAKWITCNIIRPGNSGSYLSDQLTCAQFMTCPTNPSGTIRDCSKAPRVVNCEMGGGQGNTVFAQAISAWAAAGITAVFPAGNTGPECGTVTSPADADNMISIAATTSSDGLASFSGRGPSITGQLKIDFGAPGLSVESSSYASDNARVVSSGTSASSPHVGGVVALMLSVNPNLTYDQIRNTLRVTANRALEATGQTCGNTKDGVYPNNMYGYGRIDALSAVNRVRIPGTCDGLTASTCDSLFFCSYDAAAKKCQKWWS